MENKLITGLVIVVLIVSVLSLSITFVKVSDFKEKLTGYYVGYVNLSIATSIILNISNDSIDFGSGAITEAQTNASLWTNRTKGYILRGNWSVTGTNAIVIENIGNINCSVNLTTNDDASTLFGGSAANRAYKWNWSNKEAGACGDGLSNVGPITNDLFTDVTKTPTETRICDQFGFSDGVDELYLDVFLTVPYDGNTGVLGDVITITGNTAV